MTKASFPLIAKSNSQAGSENFHPITIFESTRCELASWLLAIAMSGKEALRYRLQPVLWELKDNKTAAILVPNSMKEIRFLIYQQHGHRDVQSIFIHPH